MKRFTSLLLVLAIILTTMPIYASADKTEEVLKIVKERIPSTEEYTVFDSHSYTNEQGTVYNFYWETEDDSGKSLNVGVTEQGIVTSYHYYEKRDDNIKPTINKKSTKDMLPFANDLLKQINPDIFNSLKLEVQSEYESINSNTYSFIITRVENGIPVYGDGGYMTITSDGSAIDSFNLQYTTGLSFDVTPPAIDKAEAEKLYGEKIGMTLCYRTKYDDRTRSAYPVYTPNDDGNKYINAVTGEVFTPVQPKYDGGMLKNEAAMDSMTSANGALSPAEQAEIDALEGVMSKEEAEGIVRNNSYIFTEGTTAELNSVRLTKDYYEEGKYIYSFDFEGENRYIYASLNGATGEILSFSNYVYEKSEDKISEEEAKNTAFAVVNALALKIDEYKYEESENGYRWTRYVNGIPYYDDTISVRVNMYTGDVEAYSMGYSNIEFTPLNNIVTKETALESMFKAIEYSTYYVPTCSQEGLKFYDSTAIVYMADVMPQVDAATGEAINVTYTNSQIPEYTDVKGHYAENQINTLRKFGIGFHSETFMPDEVITEKDFLAFMMWAVTGGNVVIYDGFNYETVLRRAKNQGLLDTTDDGSDVSLTRETAAVLMVKMLGYGEVAAIEGIYKCPFTDVTTNIGYISILSGMGVVNGNGNGLFNPNESITRADAAIMIYNYLVK